MTDDEIRAALLRLCNDLTNQRLVRELYDDDAVLEFPQSGERMVGLANIQGMRAAYPADVDLTLQRLRGDGAFWIGEYTVRYNGGPPMFGAVILEIRGGRIVHETIYFGEPFDRPAWRTPWVEPADDAHEGQNTP